jgi:hypothetical protein
LLRTSRSAARDGFGRSMLERDHRSNAQRGSPLCILELICSDRNIDDW